MSRDLIEALRAITDKNTPIPILGKVIANSYNSTKKTVNVEPIDGSAALFQINLNGDASKSFLIIPEDNSLVGVTMVSNTVGFISFFSQVKEIYLRGDENGGLIKINDLKTQYDSMITGFKAAIAAGFTALSGIDSGASLAAFNASAAAVVVLNKTTLENTTVKHGNS